MKPSLRGSIKHQISAAHDALKDIEALVKANPEPKVASEVPAVLGAFLTKVEKLMAKAG